MSTMKDSNPPENPPVGITETEEEDEDDYLKMIFEDPICKTETLTQKKKRQAREAEIKGRPKSKIEIAAEERAKRDAALNTSSVDTSSKGFKMMAALGYKPGTALGVARDANGSNDSATTTGGDDRLLTPIGLEMKEDRSGIGADSEKKRKFREEVAAREDGEKKRKVEESEFRERQQREKEEKRLEGQVIGAMKVCQRLEEEEGTSVVVQQPGTGEAHEKERTFVHGKKRLRDVNVLWRGLVKERALRERDRRMRYDLHQSLSRIPTYDDPEEDKDDQIALSRNKKLEEVDVDLDEDDEELEQFQALSVADKLDQLVAYLREKWYYCFWCKYRYPDTKMDGCPGKTEADHD